MDTIKICNVSKVYTDGKSKVQALDGVSFNIKKGEILGLLGTNGAGKTTLISILCGLLSKDSGNVKILGLDLEKDLDEIKARINVVFGFTMVSINMTVFEFLNYYALLYGVDDKCLISELIKEFSLEKKKEALVRDLSSGYKQRVLLAKALLNRPEIIYMDEPTVGLDVGMAIRIRKIICSLKEKGTTIIFTSHNLEEVEQLCDRIVLISRGKIVQVGTIEEIKGRIRDNTIVEVVCKSPESFMRMMKKDPIVKKASMVSDKVIIVAKNEKDVNDIIRKSVNSTHIIISIRKIEPTLEQAFLSLMEGDNDD